MSLLFDQRRSIWEKAVWRMPTLSDAELGTGYAGLYTDTPDNHPIIDKVEGIEGLYIAAGVASSAALPLIPLILRRAQHERPHASHGFPCPGHRNDGREGMDSGSEVGNDGGEGMDSRLGALAAGSGAGRTEKERNVEKEGGRIELVEVRQCLGKS